MKTGHPLIQWLEGKLTTVLLSQINKSTQWYGISIWNKARGSSGNSLDNRQRGRAIEPYQITRTYLPKSSAGLTTPSTKEA